LIVVMGMVLMIGSLGQEEEYFDEDLYEPYEE